MFNWQQQYLAFLTRCLIYTSNFIQINIMLLVVDFPQSTNSDAGSLIAF